MFHIQKEKENNVLQLKNIVKTYVAGDTKQDALKGVSMNFRENEFVSILGQSGSGKTTLLNIIGGLDRYTSGDLIINGVSTSKYKDADWDYYRNHSIGFVFQSYNLIPHQSVLSNVELALTLAGISKKERRARAIEVLKKVGLADHIHKRPNQMSGGQMQRVAIARALINNPDILLADEPTGALDSETSVQIMELLKEIAKDKLVIMVTHNPELAAKYSTRIIRVLDGCIVDDTDPYNVPDQISVIPQKRKKISMSMGTAVSLSFNNLKTKKGRTLLTSFAGSIGIIGIALILSLSTGIQDYVNDLQRDTLSSYPVSIEKEESPLASILTASASEEDGGDTEKKENTVYSNNRMYELFNAMFASDSETNNLTKFKSYLDERMAEDGDEKESDVLKDHVETIQYQYDVKLNTYIETEDGYRSTDMSSVFTNGATSQSTSSDDSSDNSMASMMGMSSSSMSQMSNSMMSLWSELLPGSDGELISDMVYDQYDLEAGRWPEAANELVLIMSDQNEITDVAFYALGLMSDEEVTDMMKAVMKSETLSTKQREISYDDILETTFKLILNPDYYTKEANGTWSYIGDDKDSMNLVIDHGYDLKIVGIIKPNPDAAVTSATGSFGYTSALTQYVIEQTNNSELVKEQKLPENENLDLLTGLPFVITEENDPTDEEKAEKIKEYFAGLNDVEKTKIYTEILSEPTDEEIEQMTSMYMNNFSSRDAIITLVASTMGMDEETAKSYLEDYSDEELQEMLQKQLVQMIKENKSDSAQAQVLQMRVNATEQGDLFGTAGYAAVAKAFDELIDSTDDTTVLAKYYDEYMPSTVSGSTLEETLQKLSAVDINSPSAINIYAKSFDDKEKIADVITQYNETAEEDDQISYTDYVALLMSGVNTMINAVSYGLIAFVSISLIVSSIMIGIITYISVLERTKEIGILRSVGASKKDISRVFNAETAIIGLTAGLMGIGVTLLLNIPISMVIDNLTGIGNIAKLPVMGAVILVAISVALTMIAGLIPSKLAAKKDPVIALRSE
ncbi:ABC transporter, ATP-binding protein [Clostridiales bacterium KLE1615]|nr:ABC transporter, ATP-binding protein [Clostridiales bacterium KLE1615]